MADVKGSQGWKDYQSVFTAATAGMEGVDKDKVKKVVYEMSKVRPLEKQLLRRRAPFNLLPVTGSGFVLDLIRTRHLSRMRKGSRHRPRPSFKSLSSRLPSLQRLKCCIMQGGVLQLSHSFSGPRTGVTSALAKSGQILCYYSASLMPEAAL